MIDKNPTIARHDALSLLRRGDSFFPEIYPPERPALTLVGPTTSNYRKYRTRNPVVRGLIDRFYRRVAGLIDLPGPASVLDVGCGEGEAIERLAYRLSGRVAGCDINPVCVEYAARRFPGHSFHAADIYDLASSFGRFDLVLCLEVLEHLHEPTRALEQLAAATSGQLIVSVPHEPYFRAGCLLRGKHLTRLGHHPEHVQAWNETQFSRFLGARFSSVEIALSFPWIIARCRHGQ